MRIIGGRFKGRQLISFHAQHIRPTTDRVKESIFNRLMGEVEGARVLDLFSGTGNLALEALSRNAASVYCVDQHVKSLKIIKENIKKLGITEGIEVHKCEVIRFLKTWQGPPFDLIFVDPPFTESMAHLVLDALSSSRVIGLMTTIVIESSHHERLDNHYRPLVKMVGKSFGDKNLSFFKIQGEPSE